MQKLSGYLKTTVKEVKKLDEGSDGELNLLYYLFHKHNMSPGEFYKLTPGERVLVNAFCEKECER